MESVNLRVAEFPDVTPGDISRRSEGCTWKLEEARIDVETGFVDCIGANSSTGALAGLVRASDHNAPLDP